MDLKRDIYLSIFFIVMWSVYIMWVTVSAGALWVGVGTCLGLALFGAFMIMKRIKRDDKR